MTDGVVRAPSEFSMTFGWPPSMMATQELVVPRSIPMIFDIADLFFLDSFARRPTNRLTHGPHMGLNAWLSTLCLRNRDHCRAHHAVVQHVALLENLHDGVR